MLTKNETDIITEKENWKQQGPVVKLALLMCQSSSINNKVLQTFMGRHMFFSQTPKLSILVWGQMDVSEKHHCPLRKQLRIVDQKWCCCGQFCTFQNLLTK